MKAKIKPDAPELFLQKHGYFKEGLPSSYRRYYEKLKKLAGMEFAVEEEYGNRIVLYYPPELQTEDVVGIDLDKDLVEILSEGGAK